MQAFTGPPAAAAGLDAATLAGALAGALAAGAELAGAGAELEGAAAALVAGALLLALLEVLFLLEQPASKIATVPVAAMTW
jgi:hypothetical protein